MSSLEIIKELYDAIARQDHAAVMDLLHDDVRWSVQCTEPGPVPWFGEFRGKQEVPRFFQALASARFTDFSPRAMCADGDLVMVWLHVAMTSPTEKSVDMSEVHIWQLREGKILSLDSIEDTDAVKAAMT